MDDRTRYVTQAETDLVQAKLQALYDAMSSDEQRIIETLFEVASAGVEVRGYALPCCFVRLARSGDRGSTNPVALPPIQKR